MKQKLLEGLKTTPRWLTALAAVSVVVMLGLLVLKPLVSGGPKADGPAVKSPAAQKAAAPLTVATPPAPPPAPEGPLTRDPFKALVAAAAVALVPAAAAPAVLIAAPAAPAVPAPTPAIVPPPAAPPAAPPAPVAAPVAAPPPPPAPPTAPQTLSLLDTYYDSTGTVRAAVKVDNAVWSVAAGESFGNGFKMVSVTNNCMTATKGAETFGLCKGEQIKK